MDRLEGDEMMRHWEEASKEKEKDDCEKKWRAGAYEWKGRRRNPSVWYGISRVPAKEKEQKKEKKSKVLGWSEEKMEEKESKQELKDTKETVKRRSIDQEGINEMWKNIVDGRRKLRRSA